MFKLSPSSSKFEISLIIKDSNGNPTNKRKTYQSDSSYQIYKFYQRNSINDKKKHKNQRIPDAKEAEKILKNIYKQEEEI